MVVVEHCVKSQGRPDFWWHFRLADGAVEVEVGRAAVQDAASVVTFTTERATARAVALGEESPQRAVLEGRIRISGDARLLIASSSALARIGSVLQAGT